MEEALKNAVKVAGGPVAVSKVIGITSQAVSLWRVCPPNHVMALERLSGVSRHELRPDIFGTTPEQAAS